MKARARVAASFGAVVALACLAMMFAAMTAVAADSPKISGVDCYAIEDGNKIDVLLIEGEVGDTVFVEVEHNGKVIASRVPFTIEQGETSRIINLTIDNYVPGDTYVVRAYADRTNSRLLYEGTVYPVMANLGDAGTQAIATQTLATDEERVFTPTSTLFYDGASYMLSRDSAGNPVVSYAGRVATYSYVAYSLTDASEATVTYVDDNGTTVATQTIPVLSTVDYSYPISSVITGDDGKLYRTIHYGTISPSYSGQRDFVIHVKELAKTQVEGAYVATIKLVYVDDGGSEVPLATDSVTVTGPYEYTVPPVVYAADTAGSGVCVAYALEDNTQQKLRFNTQAGNTAGVTETVRYVKTELTGKFNYVDGSKRIGEEGRNLGSENFVVTESDPVAMPTQQTIEINGETLALAGSASDYAYEYGSTRIPVIDVYYVPADYVAPGDYEVTVNYVNLADNSVITSKSFTASADQTGDLEISTDASFEQDGESYVRLNGQENPIYHNYYSSVRSYTVYYRNVNDTLNANVTITQIRVVYEDGGTNTIDVIEGEEGDVGAAGAGAGAGEGAQAAAATTVGALNAARTYNAINGENGGLITNEEGIDSETERIEDAENPLASGVESKQSSELVGMAVPLGIGFGVAALAVIIFVVVMRRRNREADEA